MALQDWQVDQRCYPG